MAINFPSPANPGDRYSYNGYIWEYASGGYWKSVTESDYIYSASTVGIGTSVISGITGGNLYLKSFSGNNISITESNGTLTFSAGTTSTTTGNFLPLSGGTVTGATNYTAGLSANTISATTYFNLPVSAVTNGTGISASTINGTTTITNTQVQGITGKTDGVGISSSISNNVITITNTDLGSSQNIFKNIQAGGVTQFSAGSNSANLNFSGINITITSAATNTLVFSAGTVGSGTLNYLPKWTSTTGLGNSLIYDDGTNVGIGTTSPSAKLDVILPTSGSTPILRVSGASSVEAVRITQTGGGFALVIEDDVNPDSTSFVVDSTGKVGIGYGTGSTLGQLLNVNGIGSAATSFIAPTLQGTTLYPNTDVNLNIRTRDGGAGNRDIVFGTGNGGGTPFTRVIINSSGNTGIGTTLPTERLHVSGNTIISSGLTATTISATTYFNLPVSGLTSGSGIGLSNSNGNFTISYTGATGGGTFTGGTVNGATTFTNGLTANTLTSTGDTTAFSLVSTQSAGDEGGEIRLAKAQTNTTLSGTSVTIDIYQNKLRFFETGGNNRGVYIDLTKASTGVTSNIIVGLGSVYTTGNNLNFI